MGCFLLNNVYICQTAWTALFGDNVYNNQIIHASTSPGTGCTHIMLFWPFYYERSNIYSRLKLYMKLPKTSYDQPELQANTDLCVFIAHSVAIMLLIRTFVNHIVHWLKLIVQRFKHTSHSTSSVVSVTLRSSARLNF